MAGFVGGIYFNPKNVLQVLIVYNIKTWAAVWAYLETHENPFDPSEKSNIRVRKEILQWVFQRFGKEGIRTPKPDKYSLIGGMILESEIKQYPDDYFDYAFAREFVEESGLMVVREENGVRRSLFERVVEFYEEDRETPGKDYENFFFKVLSADGELQTTGVEDETTAPLFVSINLLNPGNFYPKHAEALIILLQRLVKENKLHRDIYQESLSRLQGIFAPSRRLRSMPEVRNPTLNLDNNDLWAKFTGQKGIKKLEKSR